MDKFQFGIIAEDEVCFREQQQNSDILYTEPSEKVDRSKYDRRYFYKNGLTMDKEMKCDLMSHRNKRIYLEKFYKLARSGLNTTLSPIWNHTFFTDDIVYCVEYPTDFLREKVKDRKLEFLPNWTAGNYVYFTEVFEDIKNGNAKLLFKEDKQTWIKAIQTRGGLEVNKYLQEIDETLKIEEEQEVKMSKFNITMAGGLIAEVEGHINRILDKNGEVVVSYADVEVMPASKPKPAKAPKTKKTINVQAPQSPAMKFILNNHNNGTEFTTKDVMSALNCSDQMVWNAISRISKEGKFSVEKLGPMSARKYKLTALSSTDTQ